MLYVNRSEEKTFFNGLMRVFKELIEKVKAGGDLDRSAREFLESKEVDSHLRNIVRRMVGSARKTTAQSFKEAAAKNTHGQEMYRLIREELKGPLGERVASLIADNVAYIKTIPQEWASYVTKYAAREALKGKRPEQVEAELRRVIPEHMAKNLKCIARTECAKANAAIVQARAEMCGITCYFWRCVKDERSRDSHRHMDGILVFYDDPPSPEALAGEKAYGRYHAGNTFNCRCYQEVVVDFRFLPDTFRYYRDGAIRNTTKAAFIKQFAS